MWRRTGRSSHLALATLLAVVSVFCDGNKNCFSKWPTEAQPFRRLLRLGSRIILRLSGFGAHEFADNQAAPPEDERRVAARPANRDTHRRIVVLAAHHFNHARVDSDATPQYPFMSKTSRAWATQLPHVGAIKLDAQDERIFRSIFRYGFKNHALV